MFIIDDLPKYCNSFFDISSCSLASADMWTPKMSGLSHTNIISYCLLFTDTVMVLRKKITQTNKDKLNQTSQFNDEVSQRHMRVSLMLFVGVSVHVCGSLQTCSNVRVSCGRRCTTIGPLLSM